MNDKMIIAHLREQLFDAKAEIKELKANTLEGTGDIAEALTNGCGYEPRPPTSDLVFTKYESRLPTAAEGGELALGVLELFKQECSTLSGGGPDVLVEDAKINYKREINNEE